MKKILVSLFALAVATLAAWAVPADPTPYQYIQPDGTAIMLRNHGDEHFHWTTDMQGRVVVLGEDGFYRLSTESLATMAQRARAGEQTQYAIWSSFDNPPETNFGDRKVLCLIAEFQPEETDGGFDGKFVVENPNEHFTNMLNQEGYSYNGAIGSVRDYYIDNSRGQYRPRFDVYGPVTLSQPESYYDNNGVHKAILEAYQLLEAQIPIEDYDTDGNGAVDMVLFYFPGYNEAEGGPTTTIWPHQSSNNFGNMGSKRFVRYFCTSELRGHADAVPASIGTTCHEFAHSLGLPDFYDTDYGDGGGGNNSFTLGNYDLMSAGNYNDNGRRPPYLNAVERNMLGWMEAPSGISESGDYVLEPVYSNKAYTISSSVPGEYFVLESRNTYKWDSALCSGLLVYHIDKSQRIVGDGFSAAYLWENTNKINAYYPHPCFYAVPTIDSPEYLDDYIFPGYRTVTSYVPKDWDGNSMGLSLSSIAHNGNNSTFHVTVSSKRQVTGVVTDTDGNPLEGVQVSLTPSEVPFAAAPSLLSGSLFATTGADGAYSLEIEEDQVAYQILSASKSGYVSQAVNLTISTLYTQQNFTLFRKGEGPRSELYKFDMDKSMPRASFGSGSFAVGMLYTAEELQAADAIGAQLKSITFALRANQGEKVYVLVEYSGSGVVLLKEVTDQFVSDDFVTIDLTSENIFLPEGEDVYFGAGLTDIPSVENYYQFYMLGPEDEPNGGGLVKVDFLDDGSFWQTVSFGTNTYYNFLVSAEIARTEEVEFSHLGVSFIKLQAGVPTVQQASGKSLRSTTWTLDGVSVAEPVDIGTLPAGAHTYMARLLYYDGTVERIYYDFDVD